MTCCSLFTNLFRINLCWFVCVQVEESGEHVILGTGAVPGLCNARPAEDVLWDWYQGAPLLSYTCLSSLFAYAFCFNVIPRWSLSIGGWSSRDFCETVVETSSLKCFAERPIKGKEQTSCIFRTWVVKVCFKCGLYKSWHASVFVYVCVICNWCDRQE